MSLWGFFVAEYIEKSQPEYIKSEQANREERLNKDAAFINLNYGEQKIQYQQTLKGCIIHKIVYILLALTGIASIVLGGHITREPIETTLGMLVTLISAFATLFFVWWLAYQLRIGTGMTSMLFQLGVRNFRIAGFIYAIILSISAIICILIPVINGLEYSTNMTIFIIAKVIGALAIWAMVIIESRRKIISIKKEQSHENT